MVVLYSDYPGDSVDSITGSGEICQPAMQSGGQEL